MAEEESRKGTDTYIVAHFAETGCSYDDVNETVVSDAALYTRLHLTVTRSNFGPTPQAQSRPEATQVPSAGMGGSYESDGWGFNGSCKPSSGNGWLTVDYMDTSKPENAANNTRIFTAVCNAG